MPIGGYRFRRSFGNVRSRFRGALQKNFPFYVISGRVLDLFRKFTSSDTTIPDISGEGNDATLYTGRFMTTDGTTDRGIVADCSAAGAGTYYLTGKVRPVGTTAWVGVSTTKAQNMTGLTAGVWQDFQSQTFGTLLALTPSVVTVGSGNTFFSAGDWSDIRLINAATGETVAHWQLNESADSDLDGYPALDSSGNGYHGAHTGCAGGTGETTILQTAGMDWNKYRHFNGAEKVTAAGQPIADVGAIEVSFVFTDTEGVVFFTQQNGAALYGLSITQARSAGNVHVTFHKGSDVFTSISQSGFSDGDIITAKVFYNFTTSTFSVDINGATGDGSLVGRHSGTSTLNLFQLAANGTNTFYYDSIIWNLIEYDTDQTTPILQWRGYGNTPWTDVVGSTNGIESGTFSNYLIPESDTTAGFDALGNAIAEPRVNGSQFNLFGDGEYALVADADSLDVTTAATWEIWGNFYGVPDASETIIAKIDTADQRSVQIVNPTLGNADDVQVNLSSDGLTANLNANFFNGILGSVQHLVIVFDGGATGDANRLKAYINGVASTLTVSAGTVPASLHVNTEPVTIGARPASGALGQFLDGKIGRPKIYNRALTADQVLQNYNAQKGAFGL